LIIDNLLLVLCSPLNKGIPPFARGGDSYGTAFSLRYWTTHDKQQLIRPASREDVPTIMRLIRALAAYENLSKVVTRNAEVLEDHLFGQTPYAEVLLAEWEEQFDEIKFPLHLSDWFNSISGNYFSVNCL